MIINIDNLNIILKLYMKKELIKLINNVHKNYLFSF